jgi:HEAT repeat protein
LLANDKVDGVRYAAAFALGTIGDKALALPAISEAMDHQDQFLRVAGAWAYLRLVEEKTDVLPKAIKIVVNGVSSEDHRVRDLATRAFADPDLPEDLLGPAFQKVLEGLDDPAQLLQIVDSLASLGPKVVPLCIKSLEEKRKLRFYAMQTLIQIGPDAAPAIPALVMTLDDSDPNLRREALFTLGAIGPASASATDAIAAKLTDSDADVQHAACYALGKTGPDAKAALPKLRVAMQSDDEFMRLAAVWASLKISLDDEDLKKKAVPYLVKGLSDDREQLRVECAYLLGELGEVAKAAIPALKKAQNDDSAAVRAAAAKSLEMLQ